jgi:hypothetical protein
LVGALTGTVYLDDIRLLASDPITAVVETYQTPTPQHVSLEQNSPNPFNSTTTIRFNLATAGPVELVIYNLAGQQLAVLVNESREIGRHTVQWDGRDQAGYALASGVYLYCLRMGERTVSRRLVLVR